MAAVSASRTPLQRFGAWWRWEMGRRIEVTTVIRLITIERFAKFAALFLGGIALLVIGAETDLHRLATNLQEQLEIAPQRGLARRLVDAVVIRFGSTSTLVRDEIAVGAMLYGLLEGVEGVGLLLRRRWAEYLVLVATGAFLPLEIDELLHHATLLKVAALLVNLAIIAYLVWRKRLFLERPGAADQPA